MSISPELFKCLAGAFILLLLVCVITIIVRSKDKFRFEAPPAKVCARGLYTTNGGPNDKMCKKMWGTKQGRAEMAQANCFNGSCGKASGMEQGSNPWGTGNYSGEPVKFEYTPLSNYLWQNERCN